MKSHNSTMEFAVFSTLTALGTLVMDLVIGLMQAVGFSNLRSGVMNTGECMILVCFLGVADKLNIGMFSMPSLLLSLALMGVHLDCKGNTASSGESQ